MPSFWHILPVYLIASHINEMQSWLFQPHKQKTHSKSSFTFSTSATSQGANISFAASSVSWNETLSTVNGSELAKFKKSFALTDLILVRKDFDDQLMHSPRWLNNTSKFTLEFLLQFHSGCCWIGERFDWFDYVILQRDGASSLWGRKILIRRPWGQRT